jgi:para-aminobenzoate synthetase component I
VVSPSTVEGRLRADAGLAEILLATLPGGSVTGAPKIAEVDAIVELEPVGRGEVGSRLPEPALA